MLLKAVGYIVSYWFEQMNYTYKKIWLIAFPVMMSILIEQLINITDALFLGHVGDVELGASALAGIWFLAIYMLGFGFSLGLLANTGGTPLSAIQDIFSRSVETSDNFG